MPSVLIVDDDLELLRQMTATFIAANVRVRAAPDGRAALKSFAEQRADLVVVDVIMPDVDGIETIMALKRARPEVKIIAISGGYRVGPKNFLALATHLGADDVLAKPFRMSDLLARALKLVGPESHQERSK
jgi:DNA-binding response OmpR family regulator